MTLFAEAQSRGDDHPSVDSMIAYLERGRGAQTLATHIIHCKACRVTLERHRRLLALDSALERQRPRKIRTAWLFGA